MEKQEFAYDLNAPMVRISDEAIFAGMRRLAKRKGCAFSMREWMGWRERPCSATIILQRFKRRGRAKQRAGLDVPDRGTYTSAELMNRLDAAWRKLGRRPGGAA